MGQKVHPIGMRLGYIKESYAKWIPDNNSSFARILQSDLLIRSYIETKLPISSGISHVLIERTGKNIRITIRAARPGLIIGKRGEEIEKIKNKLILQTCSSIHLSIIELKKPELDAFLVAKSISQQLEKRILFRKAIKRAILISLKAGAQGIKICASGRLNGIEIARSESYKEGRIPLQMFRANIDYGFSAAKTTYGMIGVKVWIFLGEIIHLTTLLK